jgi:hypothetical protein
MRSRQDQNFPPSNQVATPSLELPKGGGALKGIDEQFRSNPATGREKLEEEERKNLENRKYWERKDEEERKKELERKK